MLIRVRTNVGQWRVDGLDPSTASGEDIVTGIKVVRPNIIFERPLSFDPACANPIDNTLTLKAQNLIHGSMVHCRVDPSTCLEAKPSSVIVGSEQDGLGAIDATGRNNNPDVGESSASSTTAVGGGGKMRRKILPDGTIKLIPDANAQGGGKDRGFRKGMLPLRDMKMHWTLAEFSEMDSHYTFKIKRQEEAWAKGVSLDSDACSNFQNYLRTFNFQRQRFGFLYGTFEDENTKVRVECLYEPPQEVDSSSPGAIFALEDPNEARVEELASMLGLKRVGWILGHPPREEGFQMSSTEVLMAAELQLESAGGASATPFVTVKVTVGPDGNASFEAFQMSLQCMEMVAEQALEVGPNPGFCGVNETFTVIQEGKESKTVENNFFLTLVPIVQHQSKTFITQFPMANREHGPAQTQEEMKHQLSKSGIQGWTFIELLSDFSLLLFLCNMLELSSDMPKICSSVVNRDIPLEEGYKIIITSMAGMDSSY